MNLPFSSSSILIPTLVSEHQLPNASYYNTVTRAGKFPTQQVSPFSKAGITSCRICPAGPTHLLSLRRTCITATQLTVLETLKIIAKVVSLRSEPPRGQPACKMEEAGGIRRQQGRCHLTADMQEGRGSLFLLQ